MCERIIKLRLVLQRGTATIISAHVPQSGLPDVQKELFYDTLLSTTSSTNNSNLFVDGNLNEHVRQHPGDSYGGMVFMELVPAMRNGLGC